MLFVYVEPQKLVFKKIPNKYLCLPSTILPKTIDIYVVSVYPICFEWDEQERSNFSDEEMN